MQENVNFPQRLVAAGVQVRCVYTLAAVNAYRVNHFDSVQSSGLTPGVSGLVPMQHFPSALSQRVMKVCCGRAGRASMKGLFLL